MKCFLVGVGAAGNKAVLETIEQGVIDINDTLMVNSTSKDFPKEYEGKKIVLSGNDTGCGKERTIALDYAKSAIESGYFNLEGMSSYDMVILATSVEGGTGSGATPMLAQFFNKVYGRNVHIFAFTGFEDDIRGLANTVDFFKEIKNNLMVHTISNKAFLIEAGNNKMKAEELANRAMATKISVLTGQDFIEGSQNIDDTDIMKLSNTTGYITVEKKFFNKPLETVSDFEKVIKNMIYNSSAIKVESPAAVRLGIILNISPNSEDAIDGDFSQLREEYGNPFEFFKQIQWDGKKEYIAFIASGMRMPIDEITIIYNKYNELSSQLNKSADSFFSEMKSMGMSDEDKNKYNMIKGAEKTMGTADFLNSLLDD